MDNSLNKLLIHMLKTMPHSVAVLDTNLCYVYANEQWIENFGLPSDYVGKSHYELMPEIPDHWRKVHQDCLQGQTYMGKEVESLSRKDGGVFYIRRQIEPWYDDQQKIGGLILYVNVVNEIIEAENEGKKHLAHYQTLIESMSAGVVLHAADGQIIAANPQASRILGLTHDQLVGRSSIDPRWHTVHENGSPFEGSSHPSMRALQTAKPVHNVIMGVYTPNENLKWITINASPIFYEGQTEPRGVVVSFHDITTLKNALEQVISQETHFRTLFQDAPIAILLADTKGQILRSNRTAVKMFEYSEAEFINMYVEELMPTQFRDNHRHYVNNFAGNPHNRFMVSGMVLDAISKTGRYFPVEIALSYIQNQDQVNLVAFILDASERIEAEVARETANQLITQLETEKEISRLKSSFLNIVSHDFRTPLSVILTSTNLIRLKSDQLSTEQLHERLDRIDSQVHRLIGILEEVSQINKMQLAQYQLHLSALNLPAFLRQLSDEILLAYPSRPITIQIEAETTLAPLQLDELLTHHIFSNLISNAVKYSPNGGTITILCQTNAEHVKIQVQDQGIGITEEDQRFLFQPFHRASNVGTIEGSGLGLVIVKQAVEAHRGQISFESQLGVGTTFTVILPL